MILKFSQFWRQYGTNPTCSINGCTGNVCLFVKWTPQEGEVGIPWPQSLEFSLTSEGLAFSNAPFPGQAWGTNLVLLPYAGGQPNTTPAVI